MGNKGFDRSAWPPRTDEKHWHDVQKINACKNKISRVKMESEVGCRYSVLLELPYFDPV